MNSLQVEMSSFIVDQLEAKKPVCQKGHVLMDNYIHENQYGVTLEEGVAVNMDGNVVERNKNGGVYFDEGPSETGEHTVPILWH